MAIIIRWLMNANRVPVYTSDLSHELRTYIDRPTWKTVNTLRNLPLFEAWHDQNWVAGNTPKAIFCSKEVGDEPPKSVVDAFASWGHARKELENVQECESCSNNTSTTIGALVAALRKQSEIRFQRRTLVAPTCSQKREFPDETNKVKEVIKRLDEIKQELFLLSRSDNNHRVWPALEEAREHLRMERRMWYPAIPDGSKEQSATLMPRNFRIFEDIVDLSEQFAGKHNSRLKIEAHSLLSMLEIPKTVFIAGHAFLLGKWKEKRLAQEATKLLAGELPMDHIFIPDCQFELPTKFFNLPGRPPKRTISQVESASSLENGSEPEMKRSKSAGYFASSRLETLTPDPTSNINGEQSHVTPAKALSQHHGTLKGTSY